MDRKTFSKQQRDVLRQERQQTQQEVEQLKVFILEQQQRLRQLEEKLVTLRLHTKIAEEIFQELNNPPKEPTTVPVIEPVEEPVKEPVEEPVKEL